MAEVPFRYINCRPCRLEGFYSREEYADHVEFHLAVEPPQPNPAEAYRSGGISGSNVARPSGNRSGWRHREMPPGGPQGRPRPPGRRTRPRDR